MSLYDAMFTQEPMSAEECTKLSAILAEKARRQVAADRIVAALEHHLVGKRIAARVQEERSRAWKAEAALMELRAVIRIALAAQCHSRSRTSEQLRKALDETAWVEQ